MIKLVKNRLFTVMDFARLNNISHRKAKSILISLTNAKVMTAIRGNDKSLFYYIFTDYIQKQGEALSVNNGNK